LNPSDDYLKSERGRDQDGGFGIRFQSL